MGQKVTEKDLIFRVLEEVILKTLMISMLAKVQDMVAPILEHMVIWTDPKE
jgi:hypothetical protein